MNEKASQFSQQVRENLKLKSQEKQAKILKEISEKQSKLRVVELEDSDKEPENFYDKDQFSKFQKLMAYDIEQIAQKNREQLTVPAQP